METFFLLVLSRYVSLFFFFFTLVSTMVAHLVCDGAGVSNLFCSDAMSKTSGKSVLLGRQEQMVRQYIQHGR